MSDRFYHIPSDLLADAWTAAYRAWAADYRSRDVRAMLDQVTEKCVGAALFLRVIVLLEIAAVAAQMRSGDPSIVPEQAEIVGKQLEDDLMSFVDTAKRTVEKP